MIYGSKKKKRHAEWLKRKQKHEDKIKRAEEIDRLFREGTPEELAKALVVKLKEGE